MDAKEAIEEFNKYKSVGFKNYAQPSGMAVMLAFEALEKVEMLEAENARLKQDADKWNNLMANAAKVGLSEIDFALMVVPSSHPYTCGNCGKELSEKKPLCDDCGQAIKNEEE